MAKDVLTVNCENCGRFFDDWVFYRGDTQVGIYARIVEAPPPLLRELLRDISFRGRINPHEAKALLEIAQHIVSFTEVDPKEVYNVRKHVQSRSTADESVEGNHPDHSGGRVAARKRNHHSTLRDARKR